MKENVCHGNQKPRGWTRVSRQPDTLQTNLSFPESYNTTVTEDLRTWKPSLLPHTPYSFPSPFFLFLLSFLIRFSFVSLFLLSCLVFPSLHFFLPLCLTKPPLKRTNTCGNPHYCLKPFILSFLHSLILNLFFLSPSSPPFLPFLFYSFLLRFFAFPSCFSFPSLFFPFFHRILQNHLRYWLKHRILSFLHSFLSFSFFNIFYSSSLFSSFSFSLLFTSFLYFFLLA